MKSFIKYTLVVLFLIHSSFASDLKMPKELKKAYDKNTRSFEGKPGINYWQNFSEYNIKTDIDPKTRLLTGNEQIFTLIIVPIHLKALC
ncbi:MAG TPA: hypothetical protein PKD03_12810 [Ignavibacteriaceae bacterium]|nr:hypothetical protein [Ignavibacteriaceae bacterium]